MKQDDHQALRQEWRQDRARDAFREATMDEQRLEALEKESKTTDYDLAIRRELNNHNAMKQASRLYKKGG